MLCSQTPSPRYYRLTNHAEEGANSFRNTRRVSSIWRQAENTGSRGLAEIHEEKAGFARFLFMAVSHGGEAVVRSSGERLCVRPTQR